MLNEETLFIHDLEVFKNFSFHSFSFSLCFYYLYYFNMLYLTKENGMLGILLNELVKYIK